MVTSRLKKLRKPNVQQTILLLAFGMAITRLLLGDPASSRDASPLNPRHGSDTWGAQPGTSSQSDSSSSTEVVIRNLGVCAALVREGGVLDQQRALGEVSGDPLSSVRKVQVAVDSRWWRAIGTKSKGEEGGAGGGGGALIKDEIIKRMGMEIGGGVDVDRDFMLEVIPGVHHYGNKGVDKSTQSASSPSHSSSSLSGTAAAKEVKMVTISLPVAVSVDVASHPVVEVMEEAPVLIMWQFPLALPSGVQSQDGQERRRRRRVGGGRRGDRRKRSITRDRRKAIGKMEEGRAGAPRGVLVVLHGCQRQLTDWWTYPEEHAMVEAAREQGLVVLALGAQDSIGNEGKNGCWDVRAEEDFDSDVDGTVEKKKKRNASSVGSSGDYENREEEGLRNVDVARGISAVRYFVHKHGLETLPLYGVGVSSGGYMLSLLANHLEFAGIEIEISIGVGRAWRDLLHGHLTGEQKPLPKIAFVKMPRDSSFTKQFGRIEDSFRTRLGAEKFKKSIAVYDIHPRGLDWHEFLHIPGGEITRPMAHRMYNAAVHVSNTGMYPSKPNALIASGLSAPDEEWSRLGGTLDPNYVPSSIDAVTRLTHFLAHLGSPLQPVAVKELLMGGTGREGSSDVLSTEGQEGVSEAELDRQIHNFIAKDPLTRVGAIYEIINGCYADHEISPLYFKDVILPWFIGGERVDARR
eukprot:Nk52_evm8s316 gene=Nk52_evmTU8s316